jgi:hypothetical protein
MKRVIYALMVQFNRLPYALHTLGAGYLKR